MNEPTTTIIGNLSADPELRFTPTGSAVCNFTVASTPRSFDKNANEWKDGETLFMRCSAWRDLAEHIAESLQRGMRVVVTGRLKSRSWETQEGDKRTVVELDVEDVGPSLRNATAKVQKVQRNTGAAPADDPWAAPQRSTGAAPAADPWATGPTQVGSGWGSPDDYGKPPF